MCQGWNPDPTDVECTDKNSRSAAPDPYVWQPTGQPHVVYSVPTSVGEQRWTLEVAVVYPPLPAVGRPPAIVVPSPVPA